MRIYAVGGSVRDELLGLPVKDRDYVVVGATPEQMVRLGFRPVGKDFPVFLHPRTREEYALARTERKTGPGYTGFAVRAAPDVTLEEDLGRRDLTINAIARSEEGSAIDPYGGVRDLEAKLLRHVGPAFAEDPVRILRVARFAARFPDFAIAEETAALMRRMVDTGEVDHLVAERVWQELARGLMENRPSRMLEVLHGCGALARLLPETVPLFGVPPSAAPPDDPVARLCRALDLAAGYGEILPVRFALLVRFAAATHDDPEAIAAAAQEICGRLRAPRDCQEVALMASRESASIPEAARFDAERIMALIERCDALRRPERFLRVLAACRWEFLSAGSVPSTTDFAPEIRLSAALEAARAVDAGALAAAGGGPAAVAHRVRAARIAAVAGAPAAK
jgi:tRNA nucleotidyltransferase (CCA-adding enzyme)